MVAVPTSGATRSLVELAIYAREPRYRNSYEGKRLPGQIWLAVGGMALIALSLFAYFSS